MTAAYSFDGLPVQPVSPGTTLLLTGAAHGGTRELAYRLLVGPEDEGTVIVTTDQRATRIADDCEAAGIVLDPSRSAIVTCVGQDNRDKTVSARLLRVSGPGDLTGIGMRFSQVIEGLYDDGVDRIRTGVVTVSTLLSFNELRTVSRFVHTLVGRIGRVNGLGVLVMDPEAEGQQAVSNVAQFCDARVDVRDADGSDGPELRVRGLPDQPRDWTPFDPYA